MDQLLIYRSVLRVSAVVVAVVLVFQSGLIDERTVVLFDETSTQMSAMVGASASVQTTELNTITAELTQQQNLLAQREQTIAEREIELGIDAGAATPDQTVTYILASILFIQLLLIVLNYGLDHLRAKEQYVLLQRRDASQG